MVPVYLALAILLTQTIEVYRVQNRPAAELVAIAEGALGAEGQVTLDARTATLVLNGSPGAVQRTLALLKRLDQPLHSIVLRHRLREARDLRALEARIAWKATIGPVRVGTLPLGGNALIAALGARKTTERGSTSATLRLLEGSEGAITTGRAFPVLFSPYWGTAATTFVAAESGFEAKATITGPNRDQVLLELRPFAGRVGEHGELQYIGAATTLIVRPGETVVVGEVSENAERSTTDLTGAEREHLNEQKVLLISVAIEN